MNNLRLLAGLLCAASAVAGSTVCGQTVITLDEIFEAAEANSAQLRPLFSAQEEAAREISVARSGRLPEVNATLSASYIGNGFTTRRDFSDYQVAKIPHLGTGLSINLNQPLYTGGAITSAVEMAGLKETAARFATDLKRDNIRFELTGLYLDIYKCGNLRKVVESNITAADKVLAEMRARFEQGTALQNDITRYELLLANLQLERTRLDNTLAILNNNLVTIAGLPDNTVIVPDSTILARSLPVNSSEWWSEEAATSSPSLALARKGIEISRTAEKLTASERLPKIGLQAGWTIDGPILVEVPPINRNLSYWWVGLGVSYNISSLFKTNKALAKSRAATRKAIDDYDAAREGVEMAVRADHIKYLEAYEELKTREKSLELAERNYSITSTRYSADMALITDMLDAANSRLDAQQQLVNARINIIYYYYRLLFTAGKI